MAGIGSVRMDDGQAELREKSLEAMAEGFGHLGSGEYGKAEECFRAAGLMRDGMRWREEAEAAWMRGAAWINHGDAIMRAGDGARWGEALESVGKCVESLAPLDVRREPMFLEQMALAWIHKGTLHGEMGDEMESERAFGVAERLLGEHPGGRRAERRRLAGMQAVNRGRARLKAGRVKDAVEDARTGMGVFDVVEDAGAAVRARAVFCEGMAGLLDLEGGLDGVEDWIAEATDAVEEALDILRRTGLMGEGEAGLVRYGAKIYRVCQPVFLGEFVAEWVCGDGPLAGDAELKEEMRGELLLAKAEVERKVLSLPHETDFVRRQTEILRKLQAGEAALDGER